MSKSLLAAVLAVAVAHPVVAEAAKYRAKWVLIHEPSEAADKNARDFAARVERETGGDLVVEVLTKSQYERERFGAERKNLSHRNVLNDLIAGEIQLTQIYTASLSKLNPDMSLLGQPYLFRDYAHAEAVIEGPLGKRLLAMVPPSSGVRALATTYSGGFGVFGVKDRLVRRPEDMAGLRLATERAPWVAYYQTALGVEPLGVPPEAFVLLAQNGHADAVETVPSRFWEYGDQKGANVIVDTNHFLLTTMITVNEKFYKSLPPRYREIVTRAAIETGRDERQHAIRLNVEARDKLEAVGVKFVDLTPAEKEAFASVLSAGLDQHHMRLVKEKDLPDAIRAVGRADTASR